MNPLCGDEVAIYVAFGEDGETIDEVKFSGRGCAISQAATSMLMEMVEGRTATEIATLPKDELLEEIGIPLTPIRLKCALLGLGVLKVALHRAKGTPLPEEWAGLDELEFEVRSRLGVVDVCPLDELPPGAVKIVHAGQDRGRRLQPRRRALRDRGPLLARRRAALRGRFDLEEGVAVCPRHGAADRHPHRPAACPSRPSSRSRRFPSCVEDWRCVQGRTPTDARRPGSRAC